MAVKLSIESVKENHIWGVVAPAGRISRNNNLYLPSELIHGNGKTVPLFADHEDFEFQEGKPTGKMTQIKPRGYVTLHWNPQLQRLEFDGEVTDPDLINSIKEGERPYVSLAAQPHSYDIYHGHTVPLGLDFFSLSAVKDPGIPETSLNMESWKEAHIALIEGRFGNPGITDPETPSDIAQRQQTLFKQSEDKGKVLLPPPALPATGKRDFDISQIGATPATADPSVPANDGFHSDGFGAPNDSTTADVNQHSTGILVGEPMSSDAKKMLGQMQQQYQDPEKAKSVFYSTLNKIGKTDKDSLTKEECDMFPPDKENNTTPSVSTSTAGAAKGVDIWQGVMPDDRATAQQMIQGTGTNLGYSSSPSLGLVDQKPEVPIVGQHDDSETIGVRYGFADGSNRPRVEYYFLAKKELANDAATV
jgi:hypothetical protein